MAPPADRLQAAIDAVHPLLTPMRDVQEVWQEIEVVPLEEVWPNRRQAAASPGL